MVEKLRFLTTVFLLLSFPLFSAFSEEAVSEYEEVYPKQFKKADVERRFFSDMLKDSGVENPDFYMAIVFPEMMRYSENRDELETLFTKLTYTTVQKYEGCSIGPFQMKPGFAKVVEDHLLQNPELSEKFPDLMEELDVGKNPDGFSARYSRILRLKADKFQLLYLRAFCDLCIHKFALENCSPEEKLKVISVAYNVGLKDRIEDYNAYYALKSFPSGIKSKKSKWNYTELVLHFYKLFTEN